MASDSSFAITALTNYPRKDIITYIILFQDAEGWIRAAGVFSPHESNQVVGDESIGVDDKTILFQDRIGKTRPHTPIAVTACWLSANPQKQGHGLARIEVFYLDERGFIAEMELDTTTSSWNPGPLNALSAVFDKLHEMTSLASSANSRHCGSGCLRVDLFYGTEGHFLAFLSRRGNSWAKVINARIVHALRSIEPGWPLSLVHDGSMCLYTMDGAGRV